MLSCPTHTISRTAIVLHKEDLLKSSEGDYFGPGNAQLPRRLCDDRPHHGVDGGEFGKAISSAS